MARCKLLFAVTTAILIASTIVVRDLYSKAIPQTKSVEELEKSLEYTPAEKFFGTGPMPHGFGFGPSASAAILRPYFPEYVPNRSINEKLGAIFNQHTNRRFKESISAEVYNIPGYAVNLEASYSFYLIAASLNLKYLNIENRSNYGIQFQFCFCILLNVGGGVGYLFGHNAAPVYHIFIGAPLPLIISNEKNNIKLGPFKTFYCEPYLRINFFHKDKIFEIGLMFKFDSVFPLIPI